MKRIELYPRSPANPTADHHRQPAIAQGPARQAASPVQLADTIYFIASHTNPEQVVRLARACLSSGNPRSRVLIHHNYNVSHLDPATVLSLGNVDILPQHPGMKRENFGACEMLLTAIDWALNHSDCKWFVNLSGQDYPIKPLAHVERELAATPYDGLFCVKPVEECQWHTGIGRYLYRYYDAPRVPRWWRVRQSIQNRAQAQIAAGNLYPRFVIPSSRHGTRKVGIRPLRTPFRDGYQCYFGSAWWTMSRRALESMTDTMQRRPEILQHYRRTLWAPTESFFATLAINEPSLNICTTTEKRLISWSDPQSGRPDVLTLRDWNRIIASDAYFARKIDAAVDADLIDRLDQHIGVSVR